MTGYAVYMITTVYTIRLEADLSARGVYYRAVWDGTAFRTSGSFWLCYDKPTAAQNEYQKALSAVKPEYWSGCYQIGIWAEVWQDDELLKAEYVKTCQTPAFAELQKT